MAVRATMATLISTLRGRTNVSTSDITISGVTYWSDQQLQDILDETKQYFSVNLESLGEMSDGSVVYLNWRIPQNVGPYLELAVVKTLTGYVISDSDYTLDSNAGLVIFNSSATQGYVLSGYTYDLDEATAKVWDDKAAHRAHLVTIKSGPHQLWEDQEYLHCVQQAQRYRSRSGLKYTRLVKMDYVNH